MAALTPDALAGMAHHMNDDHADAVVAYARHYGDRSDVSAAKIVAMDPLGITLEVEPAGTAAHLRTPFDHEIVDTDDGRATLIAMLRACG
jgi:putative heme iron utilization protein